MKPDLLIYCAAMAVMCVCLYMAIDRIFVSQKPIRRLLVTGGLAFVLCLGALGCMVEEKPGTVVSSRTYTTIYYINGIRVGSGGPFAESTVIGRVTIVGTVTLVGLLFCVMGTCNALSLVYAKEKAKPASSVAAKVFAFWLHSTIGYFSFGVLPLVFLSNAKTARLKQTPGPSPRGATG